MFTEFVFLFLTLVGLILVDKINILVGIISLGTLSYFCTSRYLRYGSNVRFHSDDVSFFDLYIQRTIRFFHYIAFSPRWYWLSRNVKIITYLANVLKRGNIQNDSANNSGTEHHLSVLHCGPYALVDSEIEAIVDCVLREYIKPWYHVKISQDYDFVYDVDNVIHHTLTAFCSRIARTDKENFLCRVLQHYHHFLFHFKESFDEIASDGKILETCSAKDEDIHLNFKMHHWAMKDQITEWGYLQSIVSTLIESFGPTGLLSCPLLYSVVVEILTQNVIHPLVTVLTDANRLNAWLMKLLQSLRKTEKSFLLVEDTTNRSLHTHFTATNPIITPKILTGDSPGIEDLEFHTQNNVFIMDTNSNVSYQMQNLSVDSISELSSNSRPDSQAQYLYAYKESLISDANNKKMYLNPVSSLRTRSNSNISDKPAILKENILDNSQLLNPSNLRRSCSADFIYQMSSTHSLLALNSSVHNIRYCEKTDKHFLQIRPETKFSSEIEIAEEAIEKEVPPLISDIKIIDTEQQEDMGHNSYTLYSIQYNGVFQTLSQSDYPELVQQIVCIKRRFREFLALQSRLENNPLLKINLKGIKGPSKWLAAPFSNLDKKNITERKLFLESYLQQLCKHDMILKGQELQEFLAYGGDASIAFVKKPVDINVSRIEKIIFRGVKGAIDLLRTAIPHTSTEAGVLREPSMYFDDSVEDSCSTEEKFPMYLLDYSKKEPELLQRITSFHQKFDAGSGIETLHEELDMKQMPFLHHSHCMGSPTACCCSDQELTAGTLETEKLAHASLDLMAEFFTSSSASHFIKLLPTSLFQNFYTNKFDELEEEKCSRLLHLFHKSFWPDVKLVQKTQEHCNMLTTIHEMIKLHLGEIVKENKFFKLLLGPVFASTSVSDATELLLGSIQNKELNRCLLFYVFDVIIETICLEKE